MQILTIDATTTDIEIADAIPYLDMRAHATERRDDARAVEADVPQGVVLELHDVDGVDVLWSPTYGYAMVNERSGGIGNSLTIDNGHALSPEAAATQWLGAYLVEGRLADGQWSRDYVEAPGADNAFATEIDAEAAIDDLVRTCGWDRADLRVREL